MRTTPEPIAGVYVIFGPRGVYVGESVDIFGRATIKIAHILGLDWSIVKYMPQSATRCERQRAEALTIADYRRAGHTVVNNGQLAPRPEQSLRLKGRPLSPEHRAAVAAAQRTPEARARISARFLGRPKSPECRAKIRASNLGLQRSPETRARISAAKKDPSPETREKIGAAHRGKPWTPARRAAQTQHCVGI